MKKILILINLIFIFGLFGCVRNTGLHNNYSDVNWNNQTLVSLEKHDDKQKASVYFYRDDQQLDGKTINIFVDKQYLTSLLPGTVKQIELCPGKHSFTAHKTDVPEKYQVKLSTEQLFNINDNEIHYFKLVNNKDGLTFEEIQKSLISALDNNVTQQVHTLPRVDVSQQCI